MIHIPILLVFIPIISAIIIYLFKNKHMNVLSLIAQAVMTVLTVLYFLEFRLDFTATTFVFGGWDDRIGISLSNDPLSMGFVFLSLISWWAVLLYVFDTKKTDHTFLFFLMFLQGVFLGLLQTNDLFNMFVFLELTTIIVTILIAFNKAGDSFRAGLYYLLLNTSGVLAFLIGIIMVYFVFGTINIHRIADAMPLLSNHLIVKFAYILMLSGISVKSALFPVFTWLPKAHGAAKSPISALLSGLIVKGGLYLFIRINIMFATAGFNYGDFFFVIGAVGAILGVVFAFSQTSIKQLLAYSTVSQVGLITMALASGTGDLFYGGVFHVFNHALSKMVLFFGAGIIIKVYRTKKIGEIQGVFKALPVLSIAMIIAMFSLTGLPLLGGYASKSVIKYALADDLIKSFVFTVMNIGTATVMIKLGVIFLGYKSVSYWKERKLQVATLLGLSSLMIVLGLFYTPIFLTFYGQDFSHVSRINLNAIIDYAVIIAWAYLAYLVLTKKLGKVVDKLKKFNVSFETANILFIAYIVVLIVFFVLL